MAKEVNYNGVLLHGVQTLEWNEEVSYDDSHTDPKGTKYYLRFQGICHGYAAQAGSDSPSPSFIAPYSGSQGQPIVADPNFSGQPFATNRYQQIAKALNTPRCDLSVTENGITLLHISPSTNQDSDSDRDTNNGPKPSGVSITHFANDKVFRVVFTIEAEKVNCSSSSSDRGLILNNRWTVAEEMDENFQITRMIRGTIKISSPLHDPMEAQFKGAVVPGLELGFRRDRLEYEVSTDGLSALYAVTDRQTDIAAPFPATKISGSYSESTEDGVTFLSSIQVRLEAPPFTDRFALLAAAVSAGEARSQQLIKLQTAKGLLIHGAFLEHFGEVCVTEYNSIVKWNPPPDQSDPEIGIPFKGSLLGKRLTISEADLDKRGLPPYNSLKSQIPNIYGYTLGPGGFSSGTQAVERSPAVLFLLRCYLQTPCKNQHAIGTSTSQTQGGQDNSESQKSLGTNVYFTVTGTDPVQKGNNYFSNAQTSPKTKSLYTSARMLTRYRSKPVRAQCPIAASTAPNNANADQDTAIVVTLAPAVAQRWIHYEAERIGEWPAMPHPLDSYQESGITYTLLDQDEEYVSPPLTPDGRAKVFRLEMKLLYGMSRPLKDSEKIQVPMLPFAQSITSQDTSIVRSNLYNDNLGPKAPTATGPGADPGDDKNQLSSSTAGAAQ
jgi:hypothetical protein